jgi:type II secretory pathway pseudopilin PulG
MQIRPWWPLSWQKQKNSFSAMTLIELLVVIFVLWVGILSISVLITKNLSLVKNVHIQSNATILAREWLEMVYNVRDTNSLLWYKRDCAQRTSQIDIGEMDANTDPCKKYMWTGDNQMHRFTIEGWLSADGQISLSGSDDGEDFETRFDANKLYLTGINVNNTNITGYTHKGTGETTLARYVEFTGMQSLPQNSLITNSDIHHIRSVVLYKLSESSTGEVSLESFITDKE